MTVEGLEASLRAGDRAPVVPTVLAAAVVAAQIAYPVVGEPWRARLTMLCVGLFFLASVGHALATRGPRFTVALVAVSAGGGLLVEAAGVATRIPFGHYTYSGVLAPQVLGVPWVIPLAWTMMAYPALVVARLITPHPRRGPLAAALALAAWDLFLDPQMIAAGYWTWHGDGPALLGVPLSNFAGWAATALAMMVLLWPRLHGAASLPTDAVPVGLYLWTYAGSVLAHAAFLGLPGSALVGGVVMGAIVAALLPALRRQPDR